MCRTLSGQPCRCGWWRRRRAACCLSEPSSGLSAPCRCGSRLCVRACSGASVFSTRASRHLGRTQRRPHAYPARRTRLRRVVLGCNRSNRRHPRRADARGLARARHGTRGVHADRRKRGDLGNRHIDAQFAAQCFLCKRSSRRRRSNDGLRLSPTFSIRRPSQTRQTCAAVSRALTRPAPPLPTTTDKHLKSASNFSWEQAMHTRGSAVSG